MGNPDEYDIDELVLDVEVIPTWAELTESPYGGSQNTLRYSHINKSDFTVDKLPAYRQVVDLGSSAGSYSQAEWKNSTWLNL